MKAFSLNFDKKINRDIPTVATNLSVTAWPKQEQTTVDVDLYNAENWEYKGEGNANAVFSYEGSSRELRGKVVRIEKVKQHVSRRYWSELINLESLVWASVPGLDAAESMVRKTRYVEEVMMGLLGECHVFPQEVVTAAPNFVNALARRCKHETVTSCLVALQPDQTVFADSSVNEPTFCVEIKPKCGFIPTSSAIAPENSIKLTHCRFRLHQLSKLAKGKIARISKYDPCDLFSGVPNRMQEALLALLADPQNNLALFRNGIRVHFGRSAKVELSTEVDGYLNEMFPSQAAAHRHVFARLIQRILTNEGILQRLLSVQRLDEVDIEGIYPLFCHLLKTVAAPVQHPEEELQNQTPNISTTNVAAPSFHKPSLDGKIYSGTPLRHNSSTPPVCGVEHSSSEDSLFCSDKKHATPSPISGGRDAGKALAVHMAAACSPTVHGNHSRAGEHVAASQQQVSREDTISKLLSLPSEASCALLRSYLIAATGKDCGIMVTMQRMPRGSPLLPKNLEERTIAVRGTFGVVHDKDTGEWFRYKVAFVDLDLKPVAKIVHHFEHDQEIVKHANVMLGPQ